MYEWSSVASQLHHVLCCGAASTTTSQPLNHTRSAQETHAHGRKHALLQRCALNSLRCLSYFVSLKAEQGGGSANWKPTCTHRYIETRQVKKASLCLVTPYRIKNLSRSYIPTCLSKYLKGTVIAHIKAHLQLGTPSRIISTHAISCSVRSAARSCLRFGNHYHLKPEAQHRA